MSYRIELYVHGQAQSGYTARRRTYDGCTDLSYWGNGRLKFKTSDGRSVDTNLMFIIEEEER